VLRDAATRTIGARGRRAKHALPIPAMIDAGGQPRA
jgi:hypothetical protein